MPNSHADTPWYPGTSHLLGTSGTSRNPAIDEIVVSVVVENGRISRSLHDHDDHHHVGILWYLGTSIVVGTLVPRGFLETV